MASFTVKNPNTGRTESFPDIGAAISRAADWRPEGGAIPAVYNAEGTLVYGEDIAQGVTPPSVNPDADTDNQVSTASTLTGQGGTSIDWNIGDILDQLNTQREFAAFGDAFAEIAQSASEQAALLQDRISGLDANAQPDELIALFGQLQFFSGLQTDAMAAAQGNALAVQELQLALRELDTNIDQFDASFQESARQFNDALAFDKARFNESVDQFQKNAGVRQQEIENQIAQFGQRLGLDQQQVTNQLSQFNASLAEETRRFDIGANFSQQQLDQQQQAQAFQQQFQQLQLGQQAGQFQQEIDLQKQLGQGQLGLGQGQLDLDTLLGTGQLGLGQGQLDLSTLLGTGQLGQGQQQIDLQKLLGLGQQALQQQQITNQQNQFGQQFGLSLADRLSQPGFAAVADILGTGQVPQGLRQAGVNFLNPQGLLAGGGEGAVFNQIPTAGALGQLNPNQMQGLEGLLNFGGVSQGRLGQLVNSVTPAGGGFNLGFGGQGLQQTPPQPQPAQAERQNPGGVPSAAGLLSSSQLGLQPIQPLSELRGIRAA
tara:strand:+ start:3939 stop:5567 length:1629 start_codon:yes stop_codon:yes gene_type:complete